MHPAPQIWAKSNAVAGYLAVVASVVVGASALFPPIEFHGPTVEVGVLKDLHPFDTSSDGLPGVAPLFVALGVIGLLAAVVLLAIHRSSGVLARLVLFGIGVVSLAAGGFYLWYAKSYFELLLNPQGDGVGRVFRETAVLAAEKVVSVDPGRATWALIAGGVGLAVASLIPSRPVLRPAPSVPAGPAPSAAWAAPASAPPAPASAPSALPVGTPSLGPSAQPEPRRGPGLVVGLAVAGVVSAVVVAGVVMAGARGDTDTGSAVTPVAAAEPKPDPCVRRVTASDDTAVETFGARDSSGSLAGAADILAKALSAADVAGCPEAYVRAHQRWVQTWFEYAAFEDEADNFHAPWKKEWAEDAVAVRRADHVSKINGAQLAVVTAAQKSAVEVDVRPFPTSS